MDDEQPRFVQLNRDETRRTILMNKLNGLWDRNKLLYVFILMSIFLLAVVIIVFVLEYVVVNSKRYYFLQSKAARGLRHYLDANSLQSPLFEAFNSHAVQ